MFCAMQQHSQIFPIHTKVTADIVFVPFFKKDFTQQSAIAFGEPLEQAGEHCGKVGVTVRVGQVRGVSGS